MGIAPYKTFTFDGESSADYGVYITGEGVFNAPERAVEMVEIPGRNGSYALDQGRFSNIEVTYTAGMVDDSETDFADRLADVRNWLCSKKGYVRLEDDYNPDEYRMAVYSSGISVEHADLRTGEFEISFDCKPQRWLKSGETAVSVTSGDEVDNPTFFDSEPLLQVKGYGNISFNGFDVDVKNTIIGDLEVMAEVLEAIEYFSSGWSRQMVFEKTEFLNVGDVIDFRGFMHGASGFMLKFSHITQEPSLTSSSGFEWIALSRYGDEINLAHRLPDRILYYGTAETWSATASISVGVNNVTKTINISLDFDYNGTDTVTLTITYNDGIGRVFTVQYGPIVAHSTQSALGDPSYIDCEIGEAYRIDGGDITTLNNLVSFGSILPKLASGENTVTYDNTITDLKIVPRWWRI